MKRQVIFSMVTLLAVITMVSCKKSTTAQTAVLNDMNDSINYALGYANGDGIKNYYMNSVDDENAAIKAFIDALDKAYKGGADANELYQLGMNIGASLKEQKQEGLMGESDLKFNYKLVKQGIEDGLNGSEWSSSEAQNYIQMAMMQIHEEKAKALLGDDPEDEEIIIEEEIIQFEEVE